MFARTGWKWIAGFAAAGSLCVSAAAPAGADGGLTLPEAIAEAVEHNFDLGAARMRQAFPELRVEIAEAGFRWRLRPGFALERSSRDWVLTRLEGRLEKEFTTGALFQARAEWTTRERGVDGELVELRVEQPLFRRFGKPAALRQVDQAEHSLRMARWALHAQTESLMMRVVNGFADCVSQREAVERETRSVARAADLARMVELREKQGRATAVDALEMALLKERSELRLRRAEDRLVRARAELAELLGRTGDQLPELEAGKPPPVPDLTRARAEETARANRVERLQALAEYENSRRELKLEERDRYPDVRLIGDWRPVADANAGEWFVGLAGGRELDPEVTKLEIRQKEAEVRAALLRIAGVEVRISRQVRESLSRMNRMREEVEVARRGLDLAEKRLRLARGLYPSGRVGAPQLREAEEEWVEAQDVLTTVRLDRIRAAYGYLQALGLLVGGEGEE